jgi:hypothetical protein
METVNGVHALPKSEYKSTHVTQAADKRTVAFKRRPDADPRYPAST